MIIYDKGIERKKECIDEATNQIMDKVRDMFNLNPDSDKDDELYSFVHNEIKTLLEVV